MAKKEKHPIWTLFESIFPKDKKHYYPLDPEELIDRIDKLMIEFKYYRDSALSIEKLCSLTNTNRTYLSKAIPQVRGVNYCTYINTYRVAEAKNLLQYGNFDSIDYQDIAENAGFGSLRGFIRVFSTFEGCTPKQYAKLIRLMPQIR